mgnify:CR=1 FL=1
MGYRALFLIWLALMLILFAFSLGYNIGTGYCPPPRPIVVEGEVKASFPGRDGGRVLTIYLPAPENQHILENNE